MRDELAPEERQTPRLRRILEMATAEASTREHNYIGVEHVVLAVLKEGRSASATTLSARCDLAELQSEIERILSRR